MDTASAHITRLLVARGLRAFGDGCISLVLPLYLMELGLGAAAVGAIASATLLGSGLTTLAVGLSAHRWQVRTLLLAAAGLMTATGLSFASVHDFWPLLAVAFVGTINPGGGDVSVFLPLEHALLARVVPDRRRTSVFATYALVGTLAAAAGALAAALPAAVATAAGVPLRAALQGAFVAYAALGVLSALAYRGLPRTTDGGGRAPRAVLGPSRRAVYTLSALFALDAFSGGFVVQSIVALWLFQRFGLSPAAAGTIFFVTGVLTAASYLVAVRLAHRIGLVNTMVFTHLPANACLVAIPLAPDLAWAVALLFVRSALSQMDVPTRSSYVMAIVTPAERPAAASITSVPRGLAAAASPALAGALLALSPFGWPLVAAGATKIVYDLLLLVTFRHLRPPEERAAPPAPAAGGCDNRHR